MPIDPCREGHSAISCQAPAPEQSAIYPYQNLTFPSVDNKSNFFDVLSLRKRHLTQMAFLSALSAPWTDCLPLHVWGGQLFQQFYRIVPARRTQSVVRPFSLLTADDYTRVTQDFHVIGEAGLR